MTLVLAPEVRYAEVAELFAGWQGGPTDRHAWLAGEPIAARWSRAGKEVRYSANPALALRVLTGDALAEPAARLPLLDRERARALAGSAEPAEALLGITAAGLHEDFTAVPALDALTRDPRADVRAAADLALRRIGTAFLRSGAERLARHDGVPLPFMGGPATRRQLVRLIAADPPEARERRDALLRAALADDDWEVRWSGVVAAWALGSADLALDLRRCRPADGAHAIDRAILEAVRDVVGWRLTGGRSEHPGAPHLEACLDGTPAPHDRAFGLVTALRRPLALEPEAPAAPAGFCAVPAVLHWVGDPDRPEHPLRAVVPERAFTIAADPLDDVPAAELSARLSALSDTLGRPLRLPSPDELERALRGTDARRHPWGNGPERVTAATRSPWGLRRPLAGPEWVATDDGPRVLEHTCAAQAPRPAAVAALRAVAVE